ncbi:MAG: cell division topological specificity factor MinE [Candidatus Eremiobacteraeota bacterium]|nr:cell division topological specificity factor MinE [Candidatus Eremiobacteraeota bacterium]MBC5803200.1 cell division topological specificity factor MinE [Candidatus Eremiobacteraeota bacterium]MBC5824075.1 cell division topological specificity factor MinE [Candidatus Eremiobacteraeota bacterium]
MLEFLKKLFLPPERSSETAKERLRVVLLSDHLSLAPETVEALKRDLLEVISKYVEIDPAHADVTFEQREREVAMLANVPITGIRERPRPTAPRTEEPSPSPQLVAPTVDAPQAAADEPPAAALAPEEEAAVASAPQAQEKQPPPTRASYAGAPRRRRRKKTVALQGPAPG